MYVIERYPYYRGVCKNLNCTYNTFPHQPGNSKRESTVQKVQQSFATISCKVYIKLFYGKYIYQFFPTWCDVNDVTVSARSYLPINNLPAPT